MWEGSKNSINLLQPQRQQLKTKNNIGDDDDLYHDDVPF
jgi:hypothetical protein